MDRHPDLSIKSLGPCEILSPLAKIDVENQPYLVSDDQRVLYDDHVKPGAAGANTASFEQAGPRRSIFFDPTSTRVGMVTCGGICPGINDVIRGLVMECFYRYGVRNVVGFRYGYRGCAGRQEHDLVQLTPRQVDRIHEQGGSLLGTSRGPEDPVKIVQNLARLQINVLFVIGGDGTMRGGLAIAKEISRQGLAISVIGLPKTIDNDIPFIDKSFGFETAYSKAVEAIYAAHAEARGVPNGLVIVKLMGRYSGFIACYASLATSHVNFTLIPEVPFTFDGPHGLLESLRERMKSRSHAVIVVAEGVGQEWLTDDAPEKDASGNVCMKDISAYLSQRFRDYFLAQNETVYLKLIDPSYGIRGVPATASDSVFCWQLAQSAVHAGMCGKTEMMVGPWHGRLVHIPMQLAAGCKRVDPQGELWASVKASTGQRF